MAKFNPEIDYEQELGGLRFTYVTVGPQARLNIIMRRMDHVEIGPVGLCTAVSGVEALARSLAVEYRADQAVPRAEGYKAVRHASAEELVKRVLVHLGKPIAAERFAEDTWPLFLLAVKFRNLVMHECTYLGNDKTASLIAATREVLSGLASDAGLDHQQV